MPDGQRLFTLHLGRNHIHEVDAVLNDINNGTINTFEVLHVRLNEIRERIIKNNNFNPTGSSRAVYVISNYSRNRRSMLMI